ncbi:uncharacterized protein ACMZJ9_015033 [Mantella aurantiaca]
MTETEVAPAAPPPAEAAAKKKPTKKAAAGGAKKGSKKPSGPSVSELIVKAVAASKERSGVSLAALKKVLAAGGYDVDKNNSRLKIAIKSLVTKGSLVQVKGTGASGSFKISKKQHEGGKGKAPAIKKKPSAAAKAKKPATAKKVAKSPKKKPARKAPSKAKSPKKPAAKKPAAAKKATKSPKKSKAAAKSKKPAAAKSPAKKAPKSKTAAAKSPAKKAAKPKKAAPVINFDFWNFSVEWDSWSRRALYVMDKVCLIGSGRRYSFSKSVKSLENKCASGRDLKNLRGVWEGLLSLLLNSGSWADESEDSYASLNWRLLVDPEVELGGRLDDILGVRSPFVEDCELRIMTETEVAPAAPPPAEAAAKKKPTKKAAAGGAKKGSKKPSGPSVSELIVKAVAASKERSGVSLAALKKVLAAGGYDVDKNNSRLKIAIKSLVTKGSLVQVKGTGASGSFKISKKQHEGGKGKAPAIKKKPSAAAKAKKPATAKKVAKSPKKKPAKKVPSKAKSPKKPAAKKPAAAKKATKSPKKSKAAAKSKKPAAAKSPAKKAPKSKTAAAKSPAKKAAKPKKAAPKKK